MEYFSFFQDYGGVLLGLVVLALAVYFLPSGVRWYVASAGIAVLGFRVWQIYSTKKKFKAWDEKQKKLVNEFENLKGERDKLSTEVDALSGKLGELEQERDNLQSRSNQLSQQGEGLDTERQQLNQKLTKAQEAAKQTDAQIANLKDAKAMIDKAENLLKGQTKVNPDLSDEELMKLAQGIQ